ncbi:hypothetical protein FQA39_LY17886 [Lamprigera yunnana]|nr:hypothetical protein FQA39_LY17886 [Lamprigera yunnana]
MDTDKLLIDEVDYELYIRDPDDELQVCTDILILLAAELQEYRPIKPPPSNSKNLLEQDLACHRLPTFGPYLLLVAAYSPTTIVPKQSTMSPGLVQIALIKCWNYDNYLHPPDLN